MGPFTTTLIALAQLSFDGGGGGEKLFLPYKTSEEIININKTAMNLEQNRTLFELIFHLKKNINSLFKNEKRLYQFNPLNIKAKKDFQFRLQVKPYRFIDKEKLSNCKHLNMNCLTISTYIKERNFQ